MLPFDRIGINWEQQFICCLLSHKLRHLKHYIALVCNIQYILLLSTLDEHECFIKLQDMCITSSVH